MIAPNANLNGGKILVIDDNPIIQRTLYFALRDKGYTVSLAGDVATALKMFHEQQPEVVLLDLNFPPDASVGGNSMTDGFWALNWLQRMGGSRQFPIIVVSSDAPEKSQARALAAGAAAYFQKPVDKQALTAAIAGLLPPQPASSPT